MTGHFPARYNINGHFAWVRNNAQRGMPDWLNPKATSLPRLLQDAGYSTAHFGKWHLSNDMIPDSPLPSEYGYDSYGAFNCAGEQMPVHDDATRTVEFIEKCESQNRPWFVNLWIHEPHTPFHVLPKYRWRFRELEEPDNIYAAVLSHADDRIGEVLDALDRLGISEETLVIFTSDNGPARASKPTELSLMYDTATGAGFGIGAARGITAGRKGYKAALFEGGIGVPFLARWPGKIRPNRVDDSSLISAVDLLPTLCEFANVQLPDDYEPDGISQVSALLGAANSGRDKPLFWKMQGAWPKPKGRPFHWVSYAVVHDRWKLLANRDLSHIELYDIEADPLEQEEVSLQQSSAASKMIRLLEQWQATLPHKPSGSVFSSERATLGR